jgi:hypothetical protein
MNGVERETVSNGLGANGEDLNVVLERFQSWAATRTQARPATPTTKPITGQNGAGSGKDTSGTREISYDQALRASRYRRPANDVSAGLPLDPLARRDSPSDFNAGAANAAQPKDLEMMPMEDRWPQVRFAKTSADLVATHLEDSVTSIPAQSGAPGSQIKAASRSAESPASVPADAAKAARRATGVKRAAEEAVSAKRAHSAVGPAKVEAVPAPALASRQPQAKAAFRDVLKGTAALATSPAAGSSSISANKSTCLTLRVSDGEQARIQACAAQANLSVSAYLRQCALGVDELRNQVEVALLKLRQEQEREIPQPGFAAIPGIFRRFGMRCMRGFQRSGNDRSALSLR